MITYSYSVSPVISRYHCCHNHLEWKYWRNHCFFLALSFPRPHLPPFILMVLFQNVTAPETDVPIILQLFFLLSCSPFVSIDKQYFTCWIMLLLWLKVLKSSYFFASHEVWSTMYYLTILRSVPQMIQHVHLKLCLSATWDGWESATQFIFFPLWFR